MGCLLIFDDFHILGAHVFLLLTVDCYFIVLHFIGGGSFDDFLKHIGGKLTSGAFDLVLKELGLEVGTFLSL